jgi:hypothetical protein
MTAFMHIDQFPNRLPDAHSDGPNDVRTRPRLTGVVWSTLRVRWSYDVSRRR